MTSDDWRQHWRDYRGPVRVVLDDLSILHGVSVAAKNGAVCVDSATGAAWHPWQRVWPARWRYEPRAGRVAS